MAKPVWPIVDVASRRHWQTTAGSTEKKGGPQDENIQLALRSIGQGTLTPREQEVVEHTRRGQSAEAVGRILGLSSGTVRIHRKNTYSKLRINSQGELFSAFIEAITDGSSGM